MMHPWAVQHRLRSIVPMLIGTLICIAISCEYVSGRAVGHSSHAADVAEIHKISLWVDLNTRLKRIVYLTVAGGFNSNSFNMTIASSNCLATINATTTSCYIVWRVVLTVAEGPMNNASASWSFHTLPCP